jgi:hypothetical protein
MDEPQHDRNRKFFPTSDDLGWFLLSYLISFAVARLGLGRGSHQPMSIQVSALVALIPAIVVTTILKINSW